MLTDDQLWQRAADGDGDAFGQIYDRHANAIYNFCFRRVGDWASAEDLTAAVFTVAWTKRSRVRFSGDGGVLPWLYGVATNLLRNHNRAHRRLLRAIAQLGSSPQPAEQDSWERAADRERLRSVLAALNRLSSDERDVLSLCVLAGLSYEDAALALQIPVGTVRSRLSRARTRVRELSDEAGHVLVETPEQKAEAENGDEHPAAVA